MNQFVIDILIRTNVHIGRIHAKLIEDIDDISGEFRDWNAQFRVHVLQIPLEGLALPPAYIVARMQGFMVILFNYN